jgi:hypothetical protein
MYQLTYHRAHDHFLRFAPGRASITFAWGVIREPAVQPGWVEWLAGVTEPG